MAPPKFSVCILKRSDFCNDSNESPTGPEQPRVGVRTDIQTPFFKVLLIFNIEESPCRNYKLILKSLFIQSPQEPNREQWQVISTLHCFHRPLPLR